MSTRSVTRIQQENRPDQPRKLADLYRHMDGYPAVAGAAIVSAVQLATDAAPYKTRASAIVGHLLTDDAQYELTDSADNHGDLEYVYVVTLRGWVPLANGDAMSHAGSRKAAPVVSIDVYERPAPRFCEGQSDDWVTWPRQNYGDLESFVRSCVNPDIEGINARIKARKLDLPPHNYEALPLLEVPNTTPLHPEGGTA